MAHSILFNTPQELQAFLGERIRKLRLLRNLDQRETAGRQAFLKRLSGTWKRDGDQL